MFTTDEIINYLIDSLGYSEEDLEDLTKNELLDLVDDMESLKAFSK